MPDFAQGKFVTIIYYKSKRLPFSLADLNRDKNVFYYREEHRSITERKIPFLHIFLIMFRNFRDQKKISAKKTIMKPLDLALSFYQRSFKIKEMLIICNVKSPGIERYRSLNVAVLSPSQCPPCRPALGNVDRDITTLRFPKSFLSALKETRKKSHNGSKQTKLTSHNH